MHEGWKSKLWALHLSQKWRGSFHFNYLVMSNPPFKSYTLQYTNKIISLGHCVHTLPSPMIGTLQLYTCLLMLLLHSHPTHVAAYHKPHAHVHISTCTCTFQLAHVHFNLHSYTHSVMCNIAEYFTHVHSAWYSVLVWYGNPYQTYSYYTGLMMQTL